MFSVNRFTTSLVKHGIRTFCVKPNYNRTIREQTDLKKEVIGTVCLGISVTGIVCLAYIGTKTSSSDI